MARIFCYDNRDFPDPDPKLSVEDVRRQLADFFPELANAETRQETRGDDTFYTFSKRIGTKGRRSPDVVAILRRVPGKRLRVFELAAEVLDERGEVDVEAAARRQPEVNLALAEVEGYIRATRQASEALLKLPPR
ncbi:MAG TPA: PRTRC system protein C [Chloroflexota bacterium]|nr:PRTRC system protein C [Chloroflexota bacterium]